MQKLSQPQKHKKAGWTLMEMMVTVAILVVLGAMVTPFLIEHIKASFISEQRNLINQDIRRITSEMSDNAKDANFFLLYHSFNSADRNSAAERLSDGQKGDFLLLVHQDSSAAVNLTSRPVEKIVGYFREPDNSNNIGPVKKFEVVFNPATTAPIESLIPANSASLTTSEIIKQSEGIADGSLFYNFRDKSIMINGKIIHGNTNKPISDTYNFTVSPRG